MHGKSSSLVNWIVYDLSWSNQLDFTMILFVHGSPSSHWTTNLGPVEKTEVFSECICPYYICFNDLQGLILYSIIVYIYRHSIDLG